MRRRGVPPEVDALPGPGLRPEKDSHGMIRGGRRISAPPRCVSSARYGEPHMNIIDAARMQAVTSYPDLVEWLRASHLDTIDAMDDLLMTQPGRSARHRHPAHPCRVAAGQADRRQAHHRVSGQCPAGASVHPGGVHALRRRERPAAREPRRHRAHLLEDGGGLRARHPVPRPRGLLVTVHDRSRRAGPASHPGTLLVAAVHRAGDDLETGPTRKRRRSPPRLRWTA